MAVTTKDALDKLRSHLMKAAYLRDVQFGDPMQPPNDWDTFITLVRFEAKPGQESTLSGTIERRTIAIRVYTRIAEDPRPDMELKLDEVAVKLHEDILGDYDLGGTIRNVDWPSLDFLKDEIKGKEYRVIQLMWGLTVDDSAAPAASGYTAPAYDPACKLTAGIADSDTSFFYTSTGDPIQVFDIIQIDDERMVVAVVNPAVNLLLVGRGYQTTAAAHLINAPILRWGSVS